MATTIKTVITYTLNGSTREFNIPFEYLARKFIAVSLIGVDRKTLTLNTDYRFASRTVISLNRAWGSADGYTTIEFRRYTSASERLVDFTDGSILRAYDLNVAQVQTMHVAEEARDLTADTIGVNNAGQLDARGRRIVNVGEAVDPNDALTLGQVQKWNNSALYSADRADQQARLAEEARNAANTYRDDAAAYRYEAYVYHTQAEASKNTAGQYQESAKGFRDAAGAYAAKALEYRDTAWQYQDWAKGYKEGAEGFSNTARTEADRAKAEADKLVNNNQFAGTIDTIYGPGKDPATPTDPYGKNIFKYALEAPNVRAYNGMSIGSKWDGTGDGTYINWYRGAGQFKGRMAVTSDNNMHITGFPQTHITGTTITNSLKVSQGGVTADGSLSTSSNVVVGDNILVQKDSRWHILFRTTDGQNRMLMYKDPNSDLRISNGVEGGGDYVFGRSGGFSAPASINAGAAVLHSDGNIEGSAWGGYLSNWVASGLNSKVSAATAAGKYLVDVAHGAQTANPLWDKQGAFEVQAGHSLCGWLSTSGDGSIRYTNWISRGLVKRVENSGWIQCGNIS